MKKNPEKLLRKGYNIVSETGSTLVLEKEKKFSFLWFIFWLFWGILPGIIYYAWYKSKRNKRAVINKNA